MTYKLAIGKMTNGFLSKSSNAMVLPLGQKIGLGAITPLYIYIYIYIYMLNHIIRLQDVVEIITNETARALNLLTKQSTKMSNAIYQNCLALDYLLASEGGVCGKFHLSNCCLQIDDF
jgi:hypothetical protein